MSRIPALVPRTSHGQPHHTTLRIPMVRIRFQICPGTGARLGIPDVEFVFRNGAGLEQRGRTDPNGEIRISRNLVDARSTIRIFDTDYTLSIVPTAEPVTGRAGQQRRLDLLGYMTGYQSWSERAEGSVVNGDDSQNFQQAIMNFQTDCSRHDSSVRIDGEPGPETQRALAAAAGL